jgi:DMSO/TMAO reductase YedYZ molybdopterin-dependent catalytic subunit
MNPTTLVVYEMNGEPLPARHGAPARILVPGLFGEKNVKWVTAHRGRRRRCERLLRAAGLGPDFVIPTGSRIDDPDDKMQIALGAAANGIPLKGIAFAGDRGVSRSS